MTLSVVLAQLRNKKQADVVVKLIGQLRSGKVLSRGKNLEDLYFGELIKEGYKEKGYIATAIFKNHLSKRIGKLTG